MAKAGAKTRVVANAKRLKILKIIILAANVLHVSVKLILFRQSSSLWSWIGFAATSVIYVLCYASLAGMAEPTYGPSGELEDGGADLSMGGMCSYYHDLIYLAAIVQVASIVSDRIWWSFLVVPAYGLYVLWGTLRPFLGSILGSGPKEVEREETPAEKKRREKQERKQNRPRYR
ncbi:g10758 [Coccomyxa viridis]|uniref:G10758 protein n=1 Tax=Coccomyxa viridis TaxID=1274662 RepID=A0ABP1G6K8_9CHLO